MLYDIGWQDPDQLFVEVSPIHSGSDLYEESELRQIEAAFGWRPQQQVVCISMVGADPAFHRLLAQGALAIAKTHRGVIDLGGTLSEQQQQVGKRTTVIYETWGGARSEYWVVDEAWLEHWIEDESFRMIK